MRRTFGLLLVLLLLPAGAARAGWSPATGALIDGPGMLGAPTITKDDNNSTVGYLGPNSEIRVQFSDDGVTWGRLGGALNTTPTTPIGAAGTPQITNEDGPQSIAWSQDGVGHFLHWDGFDWTAPAGNEPFGATAGETQTWVTTGSYTAYPTAWLATTAMGSRIRVAYLHAGVWNHLPDIGLDDPADAVTDISVTRVTGAEWVSWREVHAGTARVHVLRWDIDDLAWKPVGGALGTAPALPVLVATQESEATLAYYDGGNLVAQHWDGTAWTAMGGTLNADPSAAHDPPSLARGGYLAFSEVPAGGTVSSVRVLHWDGVKWNAVGAPLHHDAGVSARQPDIGGSGQAPAVTWFENGSVYAATLDQLDPTPVQFSAATYRVERSAGTATVTLHRTGDLGQFASVDYDVAAGATVAHATGTVSFDLGQSDASFDVPFSTTSVPNDETVSMTLSNPQDGAALGTPSTATLTIGDGPLDTKIDSAENYKYVTVKKVPFTFEAVPAGGGATFECSLDGSDYFACPFDYTTPELSEGPHTIKVRARKGNVVDPTPAELSFFVDSVAPVSTISVRGDRHGDKYAGHVIADVNATDPAPGSDLAAIRCSLDPPTVPKTIGELGDCTTFQIDAPGVHTVYGAAVDGAHNLGAVTSATFTILPTPDTAIGGGPFSKWQRDRVPTYTSTVPGSTFTCSLDGAPFAACSTPDTASLQNLPEGSHSFRVVARSPDGVADPTPAQLDFPIAVPFTKTNSCDMHPFPVPTGNAQAGCGFGNGCPSRVHCGAALSACPVSAVCTWRVDAIFDTPLDRFTGGLVINLGDNGPRPAHDGDWDVTTHLGDVRGGCSVSQVDVDGFSFFGAAYSPGRPDGRTHCDTREASVAADQASDATRTFFGQDKTIRTYCFVLAYLGSFKPLNPVTGDVGPDDQRRLHCEITRTTRAATALEAVAAGKHTEIWVPNAGEYTVAPGELAPTGDQRIARAARHKKAAFKTVKGRVAKPGAVPVKLKLSKVAKRTLKRHFRLKLRVRVSFTPTVGAPSTRISTIILTQPPSQKAQRAARTRAARYCQRHRRAKRCRPKH